MADTNTYDLFQKVEKWTTKAKFNALDPRTIETGTEYNLTGAIDETDLASDLQTKINKFASLTTPTADSAVTMAADGTVGTKPLSDIGGKYRHDITKTISGVTITLRFFDSKSTALTANEIMIKHNGSNTAFVTNISNTTYTAGGGILNAVIPTSDSNNITFYGVLYGVSQGATAPYAYTYASQTVSAFLTDATYTVTEL